MHSTDVGSMNSFFGTQYSQEDLLRQVALRRSQNGQRNFSMAMAPPSGPDEMDLSGMVGGDSLDDIVMQHDKELQRRQSMPQPYRGESLDQDQERRQSLMGFAPNNSPLTSFQFDQTSSTNGIHNRDRQLSLNGLGLITNLDAMAVGMGMEDPSRDYADHMHSHPLSINTSSSYNGISDEMMRNMMSYHSNGMNGMSISGVNTPNLFSAPHFSNPFNNANMDSLASDYALNLKTTEDPMSGISNDQQGLGNDENDNDIMASVSGVRMSEVNNEDIQGSSNMNQGLVGYESPTTSAMPRKRSNDDAFLSISNEADEPAVEPPAQPAPPTKSTYQNIYSSSGFDMLRALMQVATRKNPEIDIGAVDMSCAFVVCDVTEPDCPIIYVSDIFERLTGYNKHEVLGRNCRFLQDPEGKVVPGSKRQNVDDKSVYYLKTRIRDQKEAQRSLINYRKGGQPFMNLLTMIPISWDTDEIRYFVGFQVDLVEQPSALASKNAGGSYTVNYSQGQLPPYVWSPPVGAQQQRDFAQTISPDDVTALLIAFKNNNAESELSKRTWDKVLLENTDDVVHVLSLKGLFLYLSPSSQKILEYDPSELVGTALSSVCHPSDIVPVTRELKDTSTGTAVNILFRIRRKKSGYTWFESHGSLCVEQGKGRKCLILVGRERPVYALSRHHINANGGIHDNEFWTKLSTSGMLLFVSSNVRAILDRQPDELIGTSIQALMRPESKVEFGRSLEKARTGKQLVYKHEIMNKRGQVFQAQTTIYPGDASEGQKPTFLVGQTRLVKPPSRGGSGGVSSRANVSSMTPIVKENPSEESMLTSNSSPNSRGDETPRSTASNVTQNLVMTQAGGVGLAIGSQDLALASEDNIFDELKTTRCTSWQFELRQMEKNNRVLAETLAGLVANKKKRKRRKPGSQMQQDRANCHVKTTPEWRRGPSGNRDLCNSCGLRWAKQTGRISPRTNSREAASKKSSSPVHTSSLYKDVPKTITIPTSHPKSHSSSNGDSRSPVNVQSVGSGGAADGVEKRSTAHSQPIHAPSKGFKDGGPRGITKIAEADEPTA